VVERLLSKRKALGSVPSSEKKKRKKRASLGSYLSDMPHRLPQHPYPPHSGATGSSLTLFKIVPKEKSNPR